MMNRFEKSFDALLCILYRGTAPILKLFGQFENFEFVNMSTRENIRLIARTPLSVTEKKPHFSLSGVKIIAIIKQKTP